MSAQVMIEAPAKLNLGLEVVGRRPDGYHELVTVFQTIDLADRLTFGPASGLSLELDGLPAPPGEDNLVLRAARLLAREAGLAPRARIRLEKRIPPGAGLGGGSSDAAAALCGLSRLWELGLGPQDLHELAASLGADVPFFLVGGTALGVGRGDVVVPLPALPPLVAALVLPEQGLSTPEVFRRAAFSLTERHKYHIMRRFARYSMSGRGLGELVQNDLQQAATGLLPRIETWCGGLREAGALAVALSGSGSCVYGLFGDEGDARRALETVGEGARTHVCHFLGRGADQGR